ncbi:hypothetical protein MKW94_012411, partial [Papaver nudicaule]|nr:hypothetical protein [Papaver nudicaule]MCL7040619.1 hypothetical protein [Papaver nudicaule]
MGEIRSRWQRFSSLTGVVTLVILLVSAFVSAERSLKDEQPQKIEVEESDYLLNKVVNFLWKADGSGYQHVWPAMKFGWQIVVGTFVGFFGAAFGSVGGVGGGGIFVPMLTLIIGFDAKSSTAISK